VLGKDRTRLKAQDGVHGFGSKCGELNYLFRQINDHDKGVDGEIEITQAVGVQSPFIAVQIKARSNVRITKKNEIPITVTDQNIEYWKNYGRPVILVLFINNQSPIYWVRVDNLKSRTIKIPISNQLDKSTLTQFSRMISEYYTKIAMNTDIKAVSVVLSESVFDRKLGYLLNQIESSLDEAKELIEEKDYDRACAIYMGLVQVFNESCSLYYNLAIILLKLEKTDEAFEIADIMYRKFPKNYETYEILGSAFTSVGEYKGAEEQYLKALALNEDSHSLWNKIGLICYWNGDFEKAIVAFRRSIALNNEESVHISLALSLTANFNYFEAIE
jgi:hypothetical protein